MAIFCTFSDTSRQSDAESRVAAVPAPKYQFGVLEDGWQYRRPDDVLPQPQPHKRQCLPPFKGCSIYKTSYKAPPAACYEFDLTPWKNRGKSEGVLKDLLEGDEKECRENFTTTTDLVYRILPQICPKMREYNSNALEWFPAQNFLPCYGNLTQHGLKEQKKLQWVVDMSLMKGMPGSGVNTVVTDNGLSTTLVSTTYCDHYREPPPESLVKERKAISRNLSSSLEPYNKGMSNQNLCGRNQFRVPLVDLSSVPMAACRFPLPILPTLPEEPPYRIKSAPSGFEQNGAAVRRPLQIEYPQLSRRKPIQACTS